MAARQLGRQGRRADAARRACVGGNLDRSREAPVTRRRARTSAAEDLVLDGAHPPRGPRRPRGARRAVQELPHALRHPGAHLLDATARCSPTRRGEQELCALREHDRPRGARPAPPTVGGVRARDPGDAGRRRRTRASPARRTASSRIEYDGRRVGRLIVGPFLPRRRSPSRRRRSSRSIAGIDAGRARRRLLAKMPRAKAETVDAHRRAPQGGARPHPLLAATRRSSRARCTSPACARATAQLEEKTARLAGGLRPAEGARSPQVELPRDREPRAPHAAHVDHRLQRDARRGPRRRAQRRAARVREDHPREGRAAARRSS